MGITEEIFEIANRRAAALQAAYPAVVSVRYDLRIDRLVLVLASGLELAFSLDHVPHLREAAPSDFDDAEILSSGLAIYFPRIDSNIYIPSLLEGFFGSRNWMASRIGKSGGHASTVAKAAASRQNGKLGGRPKKVIPHA